MTEASKPSARRPLKVREQNWAQNVAHWLSRKNISPNSISIGSVIFAFLAGFFLFSQSLFTNVYISLCAALLAGLCIQARLLCNLFDGMVAVEGGKFSPGGELYNDIPDRIADPLIYIGAAYAIGGDLWIGMGWLAALLAVLTAYVRCLAVSIGAPANFCGPMAKQHRMALMTVACIMLAIEGPLFNSQYSLKLALVMVVGGCIFTTFRRIRAANTALVDQEK